MCSARVVPDCDISCDKNQGTRGGSDVMNSKAAKGSSKSTVDTDKELAYWWTLPKEKISEILKVDFKNGLPLERVEEQRAAFGTNIMEELKPTSISMLLLEGVKQPMMILLLSIAAISFVFRELVEAVVMLFVVAAYISVEFINKFRSDRTMARLRELTQPTNKVIREGKEQEISTSDVVVGDLIILSSGVRVAADALLMESSGLLVNEATLTGESLPVKKQTEVEVAKNSNLAEKVNCVFSGTTILDGEGKAIVLAVGQQSEFGKIAKEVQTAQKQQTPLQQAMTQLSKTLALFAIIVSLIIPAVGFLRGLKLQQMVLTWLALTFLMIPGQPPVIITMALALASFELARKNVIVKRLRGAEALGSVTSILTDKTGTITENKMQVEKFVLPDGTELAPQKIPRALSEKILLALPEYVNDPTDKAIAQVLGVEFKREKQILSFEGFSDGHPWRTLTYRNHDMYVYAISGEPELLIESSALHSRKKERLENIVIKEGNLGKRVVAFAAFQSKIKELDKLDRIEILALAVLEDPVRQGIDKAIGVLKDAGIKTFIVTGDHTATTRAIADKVGLKGEIITGDQSEKMNDKELYDAVQSARLFARTTPSQKLRLVKVLQAQGEEVAVIGDGINDAPAIKSANVGVAMGEIGTDLAKETADLVLTDDNYVHVDDAVAIGRKAIDNFRKGLTYYLSAKAILLSIFIVPLALGIPFPLAPIHIILIELLMDLASSTIFVTEAAEPNILKRSPQRIGDFLNRSIMVKILRNGVGLALGILTIYLSLYFGTGNVVLSQTAAFVTWLLGHIFLALNLKQERVPLLKQGFFSNRFGTFWLITMVALTFLITNVSLVFSYINTVYLPPEVWLEILLVVFASTFWLEVAKWVRVGLLSA
jgi:Ca2+-transporting ATPase